MGSEILVACSLGWIIVSGIFGFIDGVGHPKWVEDVVAASKEGDLEKHWSIYDSLKIKSIAHAHAMGFSCVAFLIGLAMKAGMIGFSESFQTILAIALMAGIVLSSIGNRFRLVPIIAPGSILVMLGLIISFVGVFI